MKTLLTLALLTASVAHAQSWYKVASEGQTITATTAISVRYGAPQSIPTAVNTCTTVGGCWDPSVALAAGQSIFINTTNFSPDPAPYSVKELDVLQTAVVQVVTVAGVKVTVPAVVVVPPPTVKPVKTWSCTANTAVGFSLMSDGTFQISGPIVCKETL